MIRIGALLPILGLAVSFSPVPGAGKLGDDQKLSMDRRQLEMLLEQVRAKHDVPALAAAVANSDGMKLVAAAGVRKRGEKVKVTVDDQWHLGSNTKPITAWLIAWLVERGLLSWDTALELHFPELAKDWSAELRKVTVIELLTHHSGLPANYDAPGGWFAIPNVGKPREQRVALMKNLAKVKPAAKPGEKYLYSNLGYTVAAAVAEQAAKDSWENLLKKALVEPMKMKSVGHGPMSRDNAISQPWPHKADGSPVAPKGIADNPAVMGPAGGLHCSLPDWTKFMVLTLGGIRGHSKHLNKDTLAKLYDTPFKDRPYVVGGWIGRSKNAEGKGMFLAHDGSNTMNYFAAILLVDEDLAISVATNQGGQPGQKACHEVRDALIKKLKKPSEPRP